MRGDLDKLVAFVKNEFPVDAGEILDAIELLSLALDGLLEHTSIALAQSQHDRNFAKSKELVSFSEEVSDFQSEIIKWSNGLQDEVAVAEEDDSNDADDDEDSAPHEGKPIPNYAEYRVDQSVPHTLYESFTHKKACAFAFCGKKYPARDWKDLDPAPKRCTKLKVSQSGIMSAKEWDQCQGKHSRWSRSSSSYGRSRYCAGRARQSPRL